MRPSIGSRSPYRSGKEPGTVQVLSWRIQLARTSCDRMRGSGRSEDALGSARHNTRNINIIVIGIIACEIGFWVLLLGGLATRYLLRLKQLSSVLLVSVPLLDLLLLALISWDLLVNGATATFVHGLGAVYLGFTVSEGRGIIRKVDAWFAHRFAGGPEPVKVPKRGIVRVRHEWIAWGRMVLTAAIASAVLGVMILLVGDANRTAELGSWFRMLGIVTGVWLVAWPVWESVRYFGASSRERAKMDAEVTPTP